MIHGLIHILLHFAVPAMVAEIWFSDKWRRTWLIMVGTMLIDLDHFVATPLYDPNRCSIGTHPLHTSPLIALYALMLLHRKTRLVGIGLTIHIVLDAVDCMWMKGLFI